MPNPLDTFLNVQGTFNPLRPFLSLVSNQINYVSYDNQAIWDFLIENNPSGYPNPAENVWLTINSPTGLW